MNAVLGRVTLRAATLVVLESLLIALAIGLACVIRLGLLTWGDFVSQGLLWKTLVVAIVCQVTLYYNELYDFRILHDRYEMCIRLVEAMGVASFVLAAVNFWYPAFTLGRSTFVVAAFLVICVVVGWRFAFELWSSNVGPRERLLLVGTNPAALSLARELYERRHDLGVQIVGFIDPDPARVGQPVINPGIIGTIDDIPSVVRARDVDRVVVSLAEARGTLPMDKLLEMKLDGVTFDHLASVYRGVHRKDRPRKSSSELVDLLRRIPKITPIRGTEASVRRIACGNRSRCGSTDSVDGCCIGQADVGRPGAVLAASRRTPRPYIHGTQVPVDARERRSEDGACLGEPRRSADHVGWTAVEKEPTR